MKRSMLKLAADVRASATIYYAQAKRRLVSIYWPFLAGKAYPRERRRDAPAKSS